MAINKNIEFDTHKSMNRISRTIDVTYSHFFKITNFLEKEKMIKTEKEGRMKNVIFTNKGKRLAEAVKNLMLVVNEK